MTVRNLSESENSEIVNSMLEAVNSHDLERLMECFGDNISFEDKAFGLAINGKEALKQSMSGGLSALPDLRQELVSVLVVDHRAAVEIVLLGTHTGGLHNLPATGKRFEVPAALFLEFEGPQIVKRTDYWDLASLMRQLGFSYSQ